MLQAILQEVMDVTDIDNVTWGSESDRGLGDQQEIY